MVNSKVKKNINAAIVLFGLLVSSQVGATTINIINFDGFNEGLNSNVPVSPVPGNSATTLGGQFFNVFRAAADFWEQKIDSSVPIDMEVELNPLPCSAGFGTLGQAGPINAAVNFPNSPRVDTWHVIALANSIAGQDLDPINGDLFAEFNSSVGSTNCLENFNWWLGINSPAPPNTISLFDTVLHEIAHGIGFLTFVNQAGIRFMDLDDVFMLNLFDQTQDLAWANMNNAQRAFSSINTGALVWSGSAVAAGAGVISQGRNGGLLRLFAPSLFQPGSSVSHWDTVLTPNELMEPFATPVSNSCATELALNDMGWRIINTENACGNIFAGPPVPPRLGPVVAPFLFEILDEDDE